MHAHPGHGVILPVVNKDITAVVGIAGDQIRGSGVEGHETAVGGDPWLGRGTRGGGTGTIPADQFESTALHIAQVDVGCIVGIVPRIAFAVLETRGGGPEGHEAAIIRNRRLVRSVLLQGHFAQLVGSQIVPEYIPGGTGIADHQVAGVGREHDEIATARDGRIQGVVIGLIADRGQVDSAGIDHGLGQRTGRDKQRQQRGRSQGESMVRRNITGDGWYGNHRYISNIRVRMGELLRAPLSSLLLQ